MSFYIYLIGWSNLNKFYYGVKFSKNSDPEKLWKSYFTSSKYVKDFRKNNGEPDIIEVRKKFNNVKSAVLWEEKVIRRMKCVKSDRWLNRGNAGKEFFNLKPNSGSFGNGKNPWNKGATGVQTAWNKGKKNCQNFDKERNLKVSNSLKRTYEITYPSGKKENITGLKDYCNVNNWSYSWVCAVLKTNNKYKGHIIQRIDGRPSTFTR